MIDITTWDNDGFRYFESGFKKWNLSINEIYVETDEGQNLLREAILNDSRVWLKIIPNKEFNTPKRNIFVGIGFITTSTIKNSMFSAVGSDIAIIGTGPLSFFEEHQNNILECEDICCIEFNQTIYMFDGQDFDVAPAPKGSNGWIIETAFQATQTGTGDIGNFLFNAVGAGLSGCPTQIVFRYTCPNSGYIPDTGATALERFLEIAENTTDYRQQEIIKIMEKETGVTVSGNSPTYLDLWFAFNIDFLFNNPDYVLDLSQVGLTELYIVGTFTNLKGLNLSYNNISMTVIDQLSELQLITFIADHNLLGQWASQLAVHNASLKYADLSYNFFTENFLFSGAGGGAGDLDFFDMSYNDVAVWDNDQLTCKDLRFNGNRYPHDAIHGNGFWEARIHSATSSQLLASVFPQLLKDFINTENIEINELELFPDDDITALITEIATDKGITEPEATPIVKYDPNFSDIKPIDPWNPLQLNRNWEV